MRIFAMVAALVTIAGLSGLAAGNRSTPPKVAGIGCAQSLNPMNPGVGSHMSGFRLVLGRVWLPKAAIVLGRNAWRHVPAGQRAFIKFGVGVTPGSRVTLEVPQSSRTLYALAFHGVGADGVATLRLDPCPPREGPSTVWAGGYLVSRPACVPLIVHVGSRSARVRLALGRGC